MRCYPRLRRLMPLVVVSLLANSTRAEEPQDLIAQAYAKTKTASNAAEYAEIIRLCEQAKAGQVSQPGAKYLDELLSWTCNRRGELYTAQAATALEGGDRERAAKLDDQALADFERSVKLDAKRWKAVHNRGVSYAVKGKYDEAAADFLRVTEMQPEYVNAWFNLGEIRLDLGETEQAVKDYGEAIRLAPKDVAAVTRRGYAHLLLDQPAQALEDFNRAIELDEQNAEAYANRGDTFQRLGKWEEAANDLLRATRLDSQSPHAFQSAGWLMATCPEPRYRKPELAVQAAEHALQLAKTRDPKNPKYWDTLAAAYANAGQFPKAIATIDQALEAITAEAARAGLQQRRTLYAGGTAYRQSVPEL